MDNRRADLSKYRLQEAQDRLRVAEHCLKEGLYKNSILSRLNRPFFNITFQKNPRKHSFLQCMRRFSVLCTVGFMCNFTSSFLSPEQTCLFVFFNLLFVNSPNPSLRGQLLFVAISICAPSTIHGYGSAVDKRRVVTG